MKIVLYPFQDKNNPFVGLLRSALERQDTFIVETDQCNPIWLLRHRREVRVLHFHWIQSLYYGRTFFGTVFGLLRFGINLFSARIMKYRIVWTLHNLFPHNRRYKILDRFARRIMIFFSSAIVVHCDHAKKLVKEMFRVKKDIKVVPHGHYAGYYKSLLDKQAARSMFKLPSATLIFLAIGRIEPYKGIEDLVGHFKSTHHDDLLVIAGQPCDSKLVDRILREARNDERIITILRRLDDEELANLIIASDVVVAPFTKILTSGSVIAALSLGRPVITRRMGCMTETVEKGMGLLYDSISSDLKGSLKIARETVFSNPEDIIARVQSKMDWTRIGQAYYRIYNARD